MCYSFPMLRHYSFSNVFVVVISFIAISLNSFGLKAQKDFNVNGEATTYMSIHSRKEISGLGYGSIYYKKNYWEARYNYEDAKTVSLFWGHPFYVSKKMELEIIPTLGLSAGNFIGGSSALQLNAENDRFEFYSLNQYSLCFTDVNRSFFFNWSEAIYKFKKVVKLGAALQYTESMPQKNWEETAESTHQVDVGPVIGFEYKKFYLCGYFFNFWQPERHYAIGLTYRFH